VLGGLKYLLIDSANQCLAVVACKLVVAAQQQVATVVVAAQQQVVASD
tara:strand:+ start:395 stop:538 length:144 start_codon:yes stop_codon:yes gene_type:complete